MSEPKTLRLNVKTLADLCLKVLVSKPKTALTEQTLVKVHKTHKPDEKQTQATKQRIIVSLQEAGRLSDDFLPDSFFHGSLTQAIIVNGKISDAFVHKLSKKCSNLVRVNLSGCFKIGDTAVHSVLKACQGLKDLNVENCRKLTDGVLQHMLSDGPKLNKINIGGNFNMTVAGIQNFITTHENRAKFHELHLSGHAIYDGLVSEIMDKCKKLKGLAIGYSEVTTSTLMKLLRKRQSVSKLRIHWCRHFQDEFVQFLAECPALEMLDMVGNKGINKDVLKAMLAVKMNPIPLPEGAKGPQPVTLKNLRIRYCGFSKDLIAYIKENYPSIVLDVK